MSVTVLLATDAACCRYECYMRGELFADCEGARAKERYKTKRKEQKKNVESSYRET